MLEQLESRWLLSTFTVTSTADSGVGSLRAAITLANTTPNVAGVPDIIDFSLTGTGPFTIALASALPTITDPVDIDGYSQPGAIKNTNSIDSPFNGVLRIALDGLGAPAGTNGLNIDSGNTTVQGLAIMRFSGSGIRITSNSGNVITGNFIGTDITGTLDRGNGNDGIQISGVRNNRIGGVLPQHRNVISGNGSDGVEVGGSGSVDNLIIGNFIGVGVTGDAAMGNSSDGVAVVLGATATQIGGTTAAERNIISANGSDGIEVNGAATTGNSIFGNYIGLDLSGTIDLGNAVNGVAISASPGNVIGGTTAGHRNVISGNEDDGVDIGGGATGNVIQGNYLGTGAGGSGDLGNRSDGVSVLNSANTQIGGTTAGAGNVIGGNGSDGVKLSGASTTGTKIEANFIGIAGDGTTALGNDGDGVFLQQGAAGSTIGGTAAAAANRIGFNGQNGVGLAADAGVGNAILGNSIRNNVALGIDLGNDGVTANDPPANLDADTGANRLQNFPLLSNAFLDGVPTIIGSLDSAPSVAYRLEFFANDAGSDPTNHGEGQRLLGSIDVTTDAAGHAEFTVPFPAAVVVNGDFITATTTVLATGDTSEFAAAIIFVTDVTPPTVTAALTAGEAWAPAFLTFLQATGKGAGGYAIPVAPSASQLIPLPWANLNQIKLRFSEDVVVASASLVLHGVTTATAAISAFTYDPATFTATWTFTALLGVDKWLIDLADTVTDLAGNALDGEWSNPDAGGDAFPSGDGAAGGAFQFRFNLLPGDTNGTSSVLGNDVIRVRTAQFKSTTSPTGYDPMLDLNGSGIILGDDVIGVRSRQFSLLPNGEPAASGQGQSRMQTVTATSTDSSYEEAPPSSLRSLARVAPLLSMSAVIIRKPARITRLAAPSLFLTEENLANAAPDLAESEFWSPPGPYQPLNWRRHFDYWRHRSPGNAV